jgi:indole-3-glycerol phosphate synthase
MTRRRFSQAIAEGDGISIIVPCDDLEAARSAEEQRAEGIVIRTALAGLAEVTTLPVLWRADRPLAEAKRSGADACLLVAHDLAEEDLLERRSAEAAELELECVVEVRSSEELELALERVDPEIVLLSGSQAEFREDAVDRVLELLEDIPAGKLAIADADVASREQIDRLERAGVDAVIVRARNVAELVGAAPPEV